MAKIINKNTNEKITVPYNATVGKLIAYYGSNWQDWLIVPIELENEEIEIVKKQVVKKQLNIAAFKQETINYFNNKFIEFQKTPYVYPVEKSDGNIINVETDMTLNTLNYYALCTMKVGELVEVQVKDAETGKLDNILITRSTMDTLRTFLTNSLNTIEHLMNLVYNTILDASDELCYAFYQLDNSQYEVISDEIIKNYLQISQMTPEQFNTYINQLIQGG